MAGIRFLDKFENRYDVTLNFIAHNLLEPEVKKAFFDDIFGFDDILYLCNLPYTHIYSIHHQGLPEPIGIVMFTNCMSQRDCTLWAVIFDKKNRKKGYMAANYEKVKKDMMRRFSPHSCTSYVLGKNPASEHILKKLGFKKIGTKEKYRKVNGKYVDLTEYYQLMEV